MPFAPLLSPATEPSNAQHCMRSVTLPASSGQNDRSTRRAAPPPARSTRAVGLPSHPPRTAGGRVLPRPSDPRSSLPHVDDPLRPPAAPTRPGAGQLLGSVARRTTELTEQRRTAAVAPYRGCRRCRVERRNEKSHTGIAIAVGYAPGGGRTSRSVSRILSPVRTGGRPSIWTHRCRVPRAVHPQARASSPRTPAQPHSRRECGLRPCSGRGLPSRAGHPARWCALTAPFHPYPHMSCGRFVFCGTVPRVAPGCR